MGSHDDYGKQILRKAAGPAFKDSGTSVEILYGAGQPARIDATISNNIAVEIESRVSKQIRGAVLDLICHSYPNKLLVILPVHMSDPQVAATQCRNIMSRFLVPSQYRVIVLEGSGFSSKIESDTAKISIVLRELGYNSL